MSRIILFQIGSTETRAALPSGPGADQLWDALPLECGFSTWGDEIYFDIGFRLDCDATHETVDLGDVGYWPPGRALCLFYGPTPMSGPGEIRPASAVAVLGRLEGDPTRLKSARGRRVRVSRVEQSADLL